MILCRLLCGLLCELLCWLLCRLLCSLLCWLFCRPLCGILCRLLFRPVKIGRSISSLARFFTIVSSNLFTLATFKSIVLSIAGFSQISGPQIVQENIRQLSNTFPVIRQIMLKHYRLIIKWLAVFITSRLDHQLEKHVFSCSMDTV